MKTCITSSASDTRLHSSSRSSLSSAKQKLIDSGLWALLPGLQIWARIWSKRERKGLSLSIFLVLGKSRMARSMACEWWYLCTYQLGKFYSTCTGILVQQQFWGLGFLPREHNLGWDGLQENSHCCQAITGSQTASDLSKQKFSNSDNFNLLHVWKIPQLDYNVDFFLRRHSNSIASFHS